MSPPLLFLLFIVFLLSLIFYFYLKEIRDEYLRDRLQIIRSPDGVSLNPNLWRDASSLLQFSRLKNLINRSPIIRILENRLKRLSVPYELPRIITAVIVASLLFVLVLYLATGELAYTLLGTITLLFIIWSLVKYLSDKRTERVEQQLPGLVNQMITTLRSGGTPYTALHNAAINTNKPLGPSLQTLLASIEMGVSNNTAWREWSSLWRSKSCDLLSTVIRLKWDAGGEMTTILEVLLEQLENRRQRQLRIKTLTAMSKLSSYVLIALPIVLFIWTYYINPTLYQEMINSPIGSKALIVMSILMVIGFFWMRRITDIER